MKRKSFFLLVMVLILSSVSTGILLGGVRQTRVNNTNIGTNPYADMTSENTKEAYTTINPSYSNGATVYHGDQGTVPVGPQGAVAVGNNGNAVYNGYGAVVTGGHYYDTNAYNTTYYGNNIVAPPGATIPMGTIFEYAPSAARSLMVGGTRYYYDNNIFFTEVFDGGAVVYQVVPAPLGAVVSPLPSYCTAQFYNNKSYMICGSTYYMQVAGGYQVVALN